MSAIATTTDAGVALPASAASTKPAIEEGQDRFLKLLITQLKNQDPLNPMDNSQITSQMAQISTVSGIDKLNTTLQAMAASFTASQSLQATTMIGHSILAPGNALELQNGTAAGAVELAQGADKVAISIRDGSGQVLHTVVLGPQAAGVLRFSWDGEIDSGASAAPGSYSFAVEAVQGGNKIEATALALGQVDGVTQAKSGVSLNVRGIGAVALSDVRQVI